jgi:hypothetical protein
MNNSINENMNNSINENMNNSINENMNYSITNNTDFVGIINNTDFFGIINNTDFFGIINNTDVLNKKNYNDNDNENYNGNGNNKGTEQGIILLIILLFITSPLWCILLVNGIIECVACANNLNINIDNIVNKSISFFRGCCKKKYKYNSNSQNFNNFMFNISNALFIDKFNEFESCSICLDNAEIEKNNIIKLNCEHTFHTDCLNPWIYQQHMSILDTTCPLCRAAIVIYINDDNSKETVYSDSDSDSNNSNFSDY